MNQILAVINGSELKVRQVWYSGIAAYVLFHDGEIARYDNVDVVIDEALKEAHSVSSDQLHTLFGIPVFSFSEGYQLDDEQIQFTDVSAGVQNCIT